MPDPNIPPTERIIVLTNDGTAEFLYEDDHEGMGLGSAAVSRASETVWDAATQTWNIVPHWGWFPGLAPLHGFPTRTEAIDSEKRLLNDALENL